MRARLIKLPTPVYVVFSNDKSMKKEKDVFKLSDSYFDTSIEPSIEVKAIVYNINYGYNQEIMNKCKPLMEYAKFVRIVREFVASKQYNSNGQAIDAAIIHCIKKCILKDILLECRAEVKDILLTEFDMDKTISYCELELSEMLEAYENERRAKEEERKAKEEERKAKEDALEEIERLKSLLKKYEDDNNPT